MSRKLEINDRLATQVQNFVAERSFGEEQEVVTKSWYLPTQTVENLRSYIIGKYGTSRHIGAFATVAMRNWMQDDPSDDTHQMWARLKSDYDYGQVDVDVQAWNYRQYTDYTVLSKDEKTALGFSAPVSVIEEFTSDLSKNKYGSELANAIDAELVKRAQINGMQTLIECEGLDRVDDAGDVEVEKVKTKDKEENDELSYITVEDSVELQPLDVEEYVSSHGDISWDNRRGLLAAMVRSLGEMTKEAFYTYDEIIFGIEKTRRKRKDYQAIVEQAQNDDEPLSIAPARQILDELDGHNLMQEAGLTHRRQPLDVDAFEGDITMFQKTLFQSQRIQEENLWDRFLDTLCRLAYDLADVAWDEGDSVTRIYHGKYLQDSIDRYLPVLEATQSVLSEYDGPDDWDKQNRMSRVTGAIAILEREKKAIEGPRGKGIDEAYDAMKEQGKTPKSREFKRQ